MKSRLKDLLNVLVWVVLGGLLVWGYQVATSKRAAKSALSDVTWDQRKAANIATVSAGPKTKVSQTPEGTVIELAIPASVMGGLSVEYKRCVIWRDKASPAAAMSCESEAATSHFEPGEKPDNTPPYPF